MNKIKSILFYLIPHHFISRIIFLLTRVPKPFCTPAISWFIKKFNVDMSEAANEDIKSYQSFNKFFTRAIKEEKRPIYKNKNGLCSPADGHFSQLGDIDNGLIIQAKKHNYTCDDLLANAKQSSIKGNYLNGSFANIYLSPRDYHRMHMPFDGELVNTIYVPGRLFSVAPSIVSNIPRLFARNERVICEFKTKHGYVALVLVGAINVAAIETIWHGLITPPRKFGIRELSNKDLCTAEQGEEFSRFNMGSTIILLSENKIKFSEEHKASSPIKMGEAMGEFTG